MVEREPNAYFVQRAEGGRKMSERICERCGKIDFGKWEILGLIGYSLVVGCFGFALARGLSGLWSIWIWFILITGIIFWAPMFFIFIATEAELNEKRRIEIEEKKAKEK